MSARSRSAGRIFTASYAAVTQTAVLEELTALLEPKTRVALLCYCREAMGYHRQQIVEALDARDPLT